MSVFNEKYKEVFFCSALYFLTYVDVHMKIDLYLTDAFSHMLFRVYFHLRETRANI